MRKVLTSAALTYVAGALAALSQLLYFVMVFLGEPAIAGGFEILARDAGSRARAGIIRTAHGGVRTPGLRAAGDEGDGQDGCCRRRSRRSASTWCSETRSTCTSSPATS